MKGEPDACPQCDTASKPEPVQVVTKRKDRKFWFCNTCGHAWSTRAEDEPDRRWEPPSPNRR